MAIEKILEEWEEEEGQIQEIQPIRKRFRVFTIRGLSSLLQNKFPARVEEELSRKFLGEKMTPAEKADKPKTTLEQLFQEAQHRDREGRCCVPSLAIQRSMTAAINAYVEDKADPIYWKIWRSFTVGGVLLPIEESEPVIHRHWAKNWNAKGVACVPVRAEYPLPWSMRVPICYNGAYMSEKKTSELLNQAGFSVGIGSWRRQCNGPHGRFEVCLIEGISEKEYEAFG